jgi:hypothetical protein
MRPRSVIGSRASSKNGSNRSKMTEFKRRKLMEMIARMDDIEIDNISK